MGQAERPTCSHCGAQLILELPPSGKGSQKAGIISYSRGHIHIADLEQLRVSACECDHDVRSQYRRIFELAEKDTSLHSIVHLDRTRRGSEPANVLRE